MRKLLLAAAAAGVLQGCAAAGVTVAGASASVAAGTGVEHTLTGITYKTFTAPADDVHSAARKALGRMEMTVTDESVTEDGWRIEATASRRDIAIDLEHLTPTTTRMRVVANKGMLFLKDAATATEIVLQTADALDEIKAAQPAPKPKTRAKAKTKAGKST